MPGTRAAAAVAPLRPEATEDPGQLLTTLCRYLDRCALAPNTTKSYRRQARAYVT